MEKEQIKCSVCGNTESGDSNFCTKCGSKLKENCKCWLKKGDIYNCEKSKCPGYALFNIEKSKSH